MVAFLAPLAWAAGGTALRWVGQRVVMAGGSRAVSFLGSRGATWLAARGGWKGLAKGIGSGVLGFGLGALKLGAAAVPALAGLAASAGAGVLGAAGAALSGATGLLGMLAGAFEGAASGQSYGMSGPALRGRGRGAKPLHA
ncbi:hypothetical protein SUDANB121_03576 [Nocardiopsis dassonvillei]|uniref:hypothetical protein n=1 Tax=Nocardiopsis dassonvillei TaxID=2014 RepID=UPI003F56A8BB